jgi:hypothetical protein
MKNSSSLSLCALVAVVLAGCRSEPPHYPTVEAEADVQKGSTQQTAVAVESAPPILQCPPGTALLGIGPPKGTEVWCATKPGDQKHGPSIRWWGDAAKQAEGSYKKGQLDGQWTWWHANGEKSKEGTFAAGKKVGTWTFWNAEGFKVGEARFEAGRMVEQQTWERAANGKIKTNRVNAKDLGNRSNDYEAPPILPLPGTTAP